MFADYCLVEREQAGPPKSLHTDLASTLLKVKMSQRRYSHLTLRRTVLVTALVDAMSQLLRVLVNVQLVLISKV